MECSLPINRRRLAVVTAALLLACLRGASSQTPSCSNPSEVVFVVDQSSSVSSTNWPLIQNFMNAIVQASAVSPTGTRFALVTFSDQATIGFSLSQFTTSSSVQNAINSIAYGTGGRDIYKGINLARTQILGIGFGVRPDVQQTIILITDGPATEDTTLTLTEATACYTAGIGLFAIGIGSQLNLTELQLISSPPHTQGTNYWTVTDFSSLSSIVPNVLTQTCAPAKTATAVCSAADIVFAFDISSTSTSFTILQNFLTEFITLYLPIGNQAVQLAVVTYDNTKATVQFNLNQFSTEMAIKQSIENIPYIPTPSAANPVFALQLINSSIFTSSGGARGSNYKKIIVIMADNALPNPTAAAQIAALYRQQGVRVFAVGITGDIGVSDLTTLATTSNDVMPGVSYVYLTPKVQLLSTLLCNPGTSYAVACPAIADIVLIMDESTSIVAAQGGYSNWNTYMLGFAQSLVSSFPISRLLTQIGVMKFSSSPDVQFYMNKFADQVSLTKAIAGLQILGGETDIAAALRTCRTQMYAPGNGERDGIPHLAILITDGQANIEADQTQIEANLTKAAGIEIFTVGITNQVNVQQLQLIASAPSATHYYYVSDYSKLNQILTDIVAKACLNLPTIPTTPPTSTTTPTPVPTTTVSTTTTSTTTTPTTTTSTTTTPTTTTPTTTTPTTTTSTTTTPTTTTSTTTTPTTTTSTTTTPTTTTSTTTTPTTTTSTTTTPTTTTSTTTAPTTTTKSTTTVSTAYTGINGAQGQSTRGPNIILPDQGPCPNKVDVVFIIDRTQNMNYQYYQTYDIGLLQAIVSNIGVDTLNAQVGAVTFSETPIVEFYLNNYTRGLDVMNALQKISYGGQVANLAAAITASMPLFTSAYGGRQGVNKVAVIVTDNPSTDQTASLAAAAALRQAGVSIVTVGVGSNLNPYELSAVCTYPASANMFTVTSAKNLPTLATPIATTLCSPTSCSSSCKGGCSQFLNAVQCTCIPGTAGPTCSNTCSNGGDIIFAVGTSSSLGLSYVQALTSFMGTLISSFDTTSGTDGPTVSRIGMVTYGATAAIQFNLNAYAGQQNNSNLLQAINVPSTPTGADNLAQAINVARTQMFTVANGDRANRPNYLVIMMDGQSDNVTGALAEAQAARNAGISILVISISTNVNYGELYALASAPVNMNVYAGANTSVLTDSWRSTIASSICGNINYCSNQSCLNGAPCTNIMSGYSCGPCPVTPNPFTGFNCERSCSGVIDLVFVLNDAGTVHLERWPLVLQFVINVVQNLDVSPTRTQVALVYYSDNAYVGFTLNQYTNRQDVIDAINNTIPYLGTRTNTSAALRLLRNNIFTAAGGDRANAPNYAIVIANGDSTVDQTLTIAEGVENRLMGTTIFTVAVEQLEFNSSELMGIASFPRNLTMMYVPSFTALPGSYGMVVSAICQNFNYCTPNPCLNGGQCQSQLGQYVCTCPQGISGVNCERTCDKTMDIVFILDNSGSVQEEYQQSVNFTRAVITGLDINSGLVRVGAIAFSSQIVGQFFLNQNINSAQAVYNSLDFYNQFDTTNTPAALEAAYSQQFTAMNGDRPNVPNVIVIVTDGYSNVNSNKTIPDAMILKNSGVTIYSIGVGLGPQWSELDGMASSPASNYVIPLPTVGDISTTANFLLNELCGVVMG